MQSARLQVCAVSSADSSPTRSHFQNSGISTSSWSLSGIGEPDCEPRHCILGILGSRISDTVRIRRVNKLTGTENFNARLSATKTRTGIECCKYFIRPNFRTKKRFKIADSFPGCQGIKSLSLRNGCGIQARSSSSRKEGSGVGRQGVSVVCRKIMANGVTPWKKAQNRTDSAYWHTVKSRPIVGAVADETANLRNEEGEEKDTGNGAIQEVTEDKNLENKVSNRSSLGSFAATAIQESLPPEGFAVLMSCAVGLMTGAGVVAFNLGVHEIHDIVFKGIPGSGAPWLRNQPLEKVWQQIVFVPVGGGVIVGLLNTVRFALGETKKEKSGSREISSFWTSVKAIGRQLLKTLGAAVTLGTGNSLGPEGPSVEIGASIASGFGTLLRNSRERKLSLVASGSAAGISSGFNAAVAGCFFAVESVLRQASVDSAPSLTTAMVLLGSVLASVVSQAGLGSDPAFRIPPYDFRSPTELPLYLLLGVLCGLVSVTLTKGSAYATTWFEWLQKTTGLPPGFLPPLGGLCVGLVSLQYPEVLYWGFANVDVLLESQFPWVKGPSAMLLLQLVGAKVVATSICRGSGLVGGVYAPSLFIGAALGSAYGKLAAYALTHADPRLHLDSLDVAAPQAYALVGMAAMLAGVCQVPLTAVLLLFELTRDYRIILPLMAAVGLSSWVASTFQRKKPREVQVSLPSSSDRTVALTDGGQSAQSDILEGENKESEQKYVAQAQELCDLEDSLCLTNLEVNEERLVNEIPVSVAMRTRYAHLTGNTSVQEATRVMLVEKEWCVLVLNEGNTLEGVLTLVDIQQEAEKAKRKGLEEEFFQRSIGGLWKSVAGGQAKVVTVYPDMSLSDAQRKMAGRGLRQLPVVARKSETQGKEMGFQVVGLLDRESIKLACRVEATRRILGLPAVTLRK
ncbi:hypothetical protein R1flu_018705 [Riccia fluitans]|uniref:Chloride channel protein n=1 Tax=Riccia fluitans TaxID=41844 RepID=A0ABD1ZGU0_9MARC